MAQIQLGSTHFAGANPVLEGGEFLKYFKDVCHGNGAGEADGW